MKFSELQRLQRREGITVISSDARIEQLEARLCTITKERDALQARIEAMEKQEPYSYIYEYSNPIDGSPVWRDKPGYWNAQFPKSSKPLYLASGAQPAPSVPERWKQLVQELVREVERKTCTHEETYRGGFMWEICESCGAKWADDEGGKPEFKWPKVVEKARAMLEATTESRP